MLTNNKKNFERSIAMLLAMLMVMAVCLTGCGSKNALAKANNDLAEAEEYFESVKDEGFTIFHKEWWNANADLRKVSLSFSFRTFYL